MDFAQLEESLKRGEVILVRQKPGFKTLGVVAVFLGITAAYDLLSKQASVGAALFAAIASLVLTAIVLVVPYILRTEITGIGVVLRNPWNSRRIDYVDIASVETLQGEYGSHFEFRDASGKTLFSLNADIENFAQIVALVRTRARLAREDKTESE